MTKIRIELMDDYFIDVDELNHTLLAEIIKNETLKHMKEKGVI